MTQDLEPTEVDIAVHHITAVTTALAAARGLDAKKTDNQLEIESLANQVLSIYQCAFEHVSRHLKPEIVSLVHPPK